jgi:DMSO reductase anchor subunit
LHPALSIIFFTTFSGLGYGLLAAIGVLAPLGVLPVERSFAAAGILLALASLTAGLLSSTLHLGHPERAWRAMSQWRSSWLSREGVCALVTYVPALLFGLLWIVDVRGIAWAASGFLSAAGAVATVICTAMIYRSLKPIRAWYNDWVVPNYLALAAMTGLVWLTVLVAVYQRPHVWFLGGSALVIVSAAALKAGYWYWIDTHPTPSTAASATGLPQAGKIRPLDPPHAVENYLLKEMGYRIARRHAAKLRRIVLAVGFAVPLVALGMTWLAGGGAVSIALALAGALAATSGTLIERWLFFAEARHTVTLYYRANGDAR